MHTPLGVLIYDPEEYLTYDLLQVILECEGEIYQAKTLESFWTLIESIDVDVLVFAVPSNEFETVFELLTKLNDSDNLFSTMMISDSAQASDFEKAMAEEVVSLMIKPDVNTFTSQFKRAAKKVREHKIKNRQFKHSTMISECNGMLAFILNENVLVSFNSYFGSFFELESVDELYKNYGSIEALFAKHSQSESSEIRHILMSDSDYALRDAVSIELQGYNFTLFTSRYDCENKVISLIPNETIDCVKRQSYDETYCILKKIYKAKRPIRLVCYYKKTTITVKGEIVDVDGHQITLVTENYFYNALKESGKFYLYSTLLPNFILCEDIDLSSKSKNKLTVKRFEKINYNPVQRSLLRVPINNECSLEVFLGDKKLLDCTDVIVEDLSMTSLKISLCDEASKILFDNYSNLNICMHFCFDDVDTQMCLRVSVKPESDKINDFSFLLTLFPNEVQKKQLDNVLHRLHLRIIETLKSM